MNVRLNQENEMILGVACVLMSRGLMSISLSEYSVPCNSFRPRCDLKASRWKASGRQGWSLVREKKWAIEFIMDKRGFEYKGPVFKRGSCNFSGC